jgi:hypothetical protein
MNTKLDEMAGQFGVDKPKKTSTEAAGDEYHNPVADMKQPHEPSVDTKKPFGALKGGE